MPGHNYSHIGGKAARPFKNAQFVPIISRQDLIRLPNNLLRRDRIRREVLPDIGKRIPHPDEKEVVDCGTVAIKQPNDGITIFPHKPNQSRTKNQLDLDHTTGHTYSVNPYGASCCTPGNALL